MIAKLKGTIAAILQDAAIIDVRGVGYLVRCPYTILSRLRLDEIAELWIETEVKQDSIQLYGFASLEEKLCFVLLQSVQGVGGRVALRILSAYRPNEVIGYILRKDVDAFKSISGIGGKLATRLVTELATSIPNHMAAYAPQTIDPSGDTLTSDVVSALVNLGFHRQNSYAVANKIFKETSVGDFETLLTACLKALSQPG